MLKIENLISGIYRCHGVRNGDRGQAAAISEGIVPDTGHRIGDGDGGQATATREG